MPTLWRDSIATLLVALAVVIYGAWALGLAIPALTTVEVIAVGILVLGVGASISAVVPGFGELLHGSRTYLAATSLLGVVALAGGIYAIATGEAIALAILALATVILWALSTARHLGVYRPQQLGRL
ncbi:MAG TPA: hypothetical protein VJ506_03015 [Candidatus Limnocylindrales bacterium]|nr:hypothetical protein [Candidatus Limnocylindrales bacterium]